MNKGIQMATGEVVGILNADDCYCEGILAKVAAAFQAHPEWDALFGDFIFVDGAGREILRREEACWDPQIVRFGMGIALHQALFVRKTTYDRLGLLRHKDFKNACDMEFLTRMAHAKCRVGHIREYVVRYRYHQFGQSADKRIVANMARETARIRREYGVPGGWVGRLLRHYARAQTAGGEARAAGQVRPGARPVASPQAHARADGVLFEHPTGQALSSFAPGKATESHIKATPRPVDSQPIATPKPPQGDPNATPMRP